MLTCAQITIRDETDIHIGGLPPSRPALNQLWLDSSGVPNALRRWNGVDWELVGQDFDLADYHTIEEMNTLFDQTNEQIALKADKTVTDSLDNRLSEAEAQITVQAGSISLAVSNANTALTNVNSLTVGGRNYILNSHQTIERSDASPANKWFTNVSLSSDFMADCKGHTLAYSVWLMSENAIHGASPIVGFYINFLKTDGSTFYYSWNYQHLIPQGGGASMPWTRFWGSGSIPADAVGVDSIMVTLQGGFTSGLIRLRDPMLERATKPSDYRPAPEDDAVYKGSAAPLNPFLNMLWLNTGVAPYTLNRWTGAAWVTVGTDKVIASGINITPDNITLRTSNFLLQLLESGNAENVLMEMCANGYVGFRELFADKVTSPSVVGRYSGPNTLYIDPGYTGTNAAYFRTLWEATESLSGKFIDSTVQIYFSSSYPGTVYYECNPISIYNISGPGVVQIIGGSGSGRVIVGTLLIMSCSAEISIENVELRDYRPAGTSLHSVLAHVKGCTQVSFYQVAFNCNNVTDRAVWAEWANCRLWRCSFHNAYRCLDISQSMGTLKECTGLGTYAVYCTAATVFCSGTVPSGSRTRLDNGVINDTGVTMAAGTIVSATQSGQQASFNTTLTQSYRGGVWRTDTADIIQGAYSETGFLVSVGWHYGCFWFGTLRSTLAGRTVRSAQISISRNNGSGTIGAVPIVLYAISNTTASGTPVILASTGILGTVERGKGGYFSLPAAIVQGLVNGSYGGLCLYESPYNFGSSIYSANYARFSQMFLTVHYT